MTRANTPPTVEQIAAIDPADGSTVLGPEADEPGYWTGCPSVTYEPERGRFLLTYRQRRPRGHAGGERGWRCAIAASDDGEHFTDLWSVEKSELSTPSMERFRLVPHRRGGYLLYLSYVDPQDNRWRIDTVATDAPDRVDLGRRQPLLTAESTGTEGVKDPYLLRDGDVDHLFVSYAGAADLTPEQRREAHATADIYNVGVGTFPTGLATGRDGADLRWHGTVLDVGSGWDRYQARITSVVPTAAGYVAFYDGSGSAAENYEERCGIARSSDLRHWTSTTPDGPHLVDGDRSRSLRYVDVVEVDGRWWMYYELTRPDGAHELRRGALPAGTAADA